MKKSIYTKLVLCFMLIFIFSNVVSSLMSYYGSEMNSVDNLEKQLINTLEVVKEEHLQEGINLESLERIVSNNYITLTKTNSLTNYELSESMLTDLANEKIIHVRAKEHHNPEVSGPIAVTQIHEDYVIAMADFDNLGFSTRQLVMEINFRSLIIGSLLVIVVARLMVKPINELIEATQKISRKDFNVRLDTKKNDELGVLMNSFNAMAQELQETEMLRDDFISDVSHEFKTPLTSISGYTKLLKDASEQEKHAYIDIIDQETKRLSDMTSSILMLNRLDHEDPRDAFKTICVDEQIRSTLVMLEPKWSAKDIDLVVDLEKTNVCGHDVLLSQVWLNVIDNAIKFSDHKGSIEITLKNEIVTIKDYGAGMSKQEEARIFDKFYKSDLSRSESGNGLGLAIVKRILDIHNYDITVESKQHKYTEFKIKL